MTDEPLWQASDVVRAVRGQCLHEQTWKAKSVSVDSRTVQPGDLFIALKGSLHDGHDHVAAAFAAGASAALVSRQPPQTPCDVPLVFVEDTLIALQELARAARARTRAKIIGITGSIGKTSTKEILRLALGAVGVTYADTGIFYNPWSIPLALACLPPNTDYGLFEMDTHHTGELKALSTLVRPDVTIITTIEAAHLEFFASTESIADATAEIFLGMPDHGHVILNRGNRHYSRLVTAAKNKGLKKILSFAREGKADGSLIDCALTGEGSAVNATLLSYNIHYSIGAPGLHLVENSLAALLAAMTVSGKIDECAMALAHYKSPIGRGITLPITLPDGEIFILIDDSSNASPVSVRAAIRLLAQTTPVGHGRRVLVLGDMRELGATSPTLHSDLVPFIAEAKIDSVFCCGEMMRYLYDALPAPLRGAYALDSATLAPLVVDTLRADDILSIKGCCNMNLGLIIDALKDIDLTHPHKIAS